MADRVPADAGWALDEYDGPRFWAHVEFHGGFAYLEDPLSRIDASAGECWLWRGWAPNGYGSFRIWGGVQQATQLAFRDFNGVIPEGHEIDHLCRTPACVNPRHLEPVTHSVNVRRGKRGVRRAA